MARKVNKYIPIKSGKKVGVKNRYSGQKAFYDVLNPLKLFKFKKGKKGGN